MLKNIITENYCKNKYILDVTAIIVQTSRIGELYEVKN